MQPPCVCAHTHASVCLTDAGAEVSVFSVTPMVVGITVVAAHRLQLDLLDLHSLCDGCVGSSCRRCCQAWVGEVEETWLLRLRLCTCENSAETRPNSPNKQRRISQQLRINACKVTTCGFIFWQPITWQQVIGLMGWIPVHGGILLFWLFHQISCAPTVDRCICTLIWAVLRVRHGTQSMSISCTYCIGVVIQYDNKVFRERKGEREKLE